jgi:hypothetical protein
MSGSLVSRVIVENFRTIDHEIVIAVATVNVVGCFVIQNVGIIIEQSGKPPRVVMPTCEPTHKNGESSPGTLQITDGRLKREITDAVVAAWRALSQS